VRRGDVITIALDHGVRVLHVCGFAPRRGDADEARVLFEDLA
jgi:ribosome-associated heat shock protein Hsp15